MQDLLRPNCNLVLLLFFQQALLVLELFLPLALLL
jgi:hypothetical protein